MDDVVLVFTWWNYLYRLKLLKSRYPCGFQGRTRPLQSLPVVTLDYYKAAVDDHNDSNDDDDDDDDAGGDDYDGYYEENPFDEREREREAEGDLITEGVIAITLARFSLKSSAGDDKKLN